MAGQVEQKLQAQNITLPAVAAPAANYVPYTRTGNLIFTSGQLPFVNDKLETTGIVGRDVSPEDAKAAARQCAINILAIAKAELGDLDKIKRIVKITAFIASDPSFTSQSAVANGASDFLVEVLGDKGKHARSAIGMAALPLNAPVEVEAIIEVAE
ncbi:MAG: RidA family protein [Methylobacterium mesophilicum]|nr:RidA family protein [Methylobacterium mesophilicum]